MIKNVFVVLILLFISTIRCSTPLICHEKGMFFIFDKEVPRKVKIQLPKTDIFVYHSKNNCFSCDTFWNLHRNNKKYIGRIGILSGDVNVCNFSFIIIDSSIVKIDSLQFNDSCLKANVWFTIKKDGETIFRAISKTDTLDSRIKVKDNRIEEMKAIAKYE